jgi:hypothetical protein
MSTMLRKRWKLLKMFLCFKMHTQSLKILGIIIGKKTPSEILYVIGRNFLSQRETFCRRKKLPVTGRNFLSQEETSSQGKKLPVTGRNFLSQKESSCHRKNPPVTIRNLLSQEETEEVIEIAENIPLLQNAYKIFINTMNPYWKQKSGNGDLPLVKSKQG